MTCKDENEDDDLSPLLKKMIADGALVEVPPAPGMKRSFKPVSQTAVVKSIREHQKNRRSS